MKIKNPFCSLSRFEWVLYLCSVAVIGISSAFSGNLLNTVASLIGVTALIFVAKGFVIGQVLTVVFAVIYGIVSLQQRYYGEMITYLFMTSPMAVCAIVSWLKNPYEDSEEVRVKKLSCGGLAAVMLSAAAVTVPFYFILRALGNASLIVSTVSVATSFTASALTFLRSSFYAIGYAANDVVLIVLWLTATLKDVSYLPMLLCFVMFLFNDLYGFYNWRRMEKRQG